MSARLILTMKREVALEKPLRLNTFVPRGALSHPYRKSLEGLFTIGDSPVLRTASW
jgi:hypothetical protein